MCSASAETCPGIPVDYGFLILYRSLVGLFCLVVCLIGAGETVLYLADTHAFMDRWQTVCLCLYANTYGDRRQTRWHACVSGIVPQGYLPRHSFWFSWLSCLLWQLRWCVTMKTLCSLQSIILFYLHTVQFRISGLDVDSTCKYTRMSMHSGIHHYNYKLTNFI